MHIPHAPAPTAADYAVPKTLDTVSDILSGIVGLIFALYVTAGLACIASVFLLRAAGWGGHRAEDFSAVERVEPPRAGAAR